MLGGMLDFHSRSHLCSQLVCRQPVRRRSRTSERKMLLALTPEVILSSLQRLLERALHSLEIGEIALGFLHEGVSHD